MNMKYKVINQFTLVQESLELLENFLILFIVDKNNKLIGSLTNGDVRRALQNGINLKDDITSIMNSNLYYAYENETIEEQKNKINMIAEEFRLLPIVDKERNIIRIASSKELFSRSNKVILMAGGLGSRLGELTKNTPKPLLHIGNKPILEIIIDGFKKYYFNDFIISVNYKAEMITNYFQDGENFDAKIEYIHESKRMGTAGCLSLINKEKLDQSFFVMNGDILTEENFEEILLFHKKNAFQATMCVVEHELEIPYGVIEADKNNHIVSLREKPIEKFNVNAGIYVLEPTVLEYIPEDIFFDMPTLFQKLKDDNQSIGIYKMKTSWIDIGSPKDYFNVKDKK